MNASSSSAVRAGPAAGPRFSVSCRRMRPLEILQLFERAGRRQELDSVFGFLGDSPLNGGRSRAGSITFPLDEIEALNAQGVGYSFTLTNLAAAPEHLRHRRTNELLKRFENPLNSVTVATPLIENYIRHTYPGYRLTASCIYNFKTVAELNAVYERFDMVATWPEINRRDDQLQALTRKDRIMLFANDVCMAACGDHRMRHYYFWSLDHIAYYNHETYRVPYYARAAQWHYLPPCKGRQLPVTMEDLDRLQRLGFRHFKTTQIRTLAERYLGLRWSFGQRVRSALITRLERMPFRHFR